MNIDLSWFLKGGLAVAIGAATAAMSSFGNPIFGGWYADPQIRCYGDTYWVFPTTPSRTFRLR